MQRTTQYRYTRDELLRHKTSQACRFLPPGLEISSDLLSKPEGNAGDEQGNEPRLMHGRQERNENPLSSPWGKPRAEAAWRGAGGPGTPIRSRLVDDGVIGSPPEQKAAPANIAVIHRAPSRPLADRAPSWRRGADDDALDAAAGRWNAEKRGERPAGPNARWNEEKPLERVASDTSRWLDGKTMHADRIENERHGDAHAGGRWHDDKHDRGHDRGRWDHEKHDAWHGDGNRGRGDYGGGRDPWRRDNRGGKHDEWDGSEDNRPVWMEEKQRQGGARLTAAEFEAERKRRQEERANKHQPQPRDGAHAAHGAHNIPEVEMMTDLDFEQLKDDDDDVNALEELRAANQQPAQQSRADHAAHGGLGALGTAPPGFSNIQNSMSAAMAAFNKQPASISLHTWAHSTNAAGTDGYDGAAANDDADIDNVALQVANAAVSADDFDDGFQQSSAAQNANNNRMSLSQLFAGAVAAKPGGMPVANRQMNNAGAVPRSAQDVPTLEARFVGAGAGAQNAGPSTTSPFAAPQTNANTNPLQALLQSIAAQQSNLTGAPQQQRTLPPSAQVKSLSEIEPTAAASAVEAASGDGSAAAGQRAATPLDQLFRTTLSSIAESTSAQPQPSIADLGVGPSGPPGLSPEKSGSGQQASSFLLNLVGGQGGASAAMPAMAGRPAGSTPPPTSPSAFLGNGINASGGFGSIFSAGPSSAAQTAADAPALLRALNANNAKAQQPNMQGAAMPTTSNVAVGPRNNAARPAGGEEAGVSDALLRLIRSASSQPQPASSAAIGMQPGLGGLNIPRMGGAGVNGAPIRTGAAGQPQTPSGVSHHPGNNNILQNLFQNLTLQQKQQELGGNAVGGGMPGNAGLQNTDALFGAARQQPALVNMLQNQAQQRLQQQQQQPTSMFMQQPMQQQQPAAQNNNMAHLLAALNASQQNLQPTPDTYRNYGRVPDHQTLLAAQRLAANNNAAMSNSMLGGGLQAMQAGLQGQRHPQAMHAQHAQAGWMPAQRGNYPMADLGGGHPQLAALGAHAQLSNLPGRQGVPQFGAAQPGWAGSAAPGFGGGAYGGHAMAQQGLRNLGGPQGGAGLGLNQQMPMANNQPEPQAAKIAQLLAALRQHPQQ